jgi:MFS superfamily sulfate permease-like transporter
MRSRLNRGHFRAQEFITLWKLKRREGVLWITTVVATLIFGIINGVWE